MPSPESEILNIAMPYRQFGEPPMGLAAEIRIFKDLCAQYLSDHDKVRLSQWDLDDIRKIMAIEHDCHKPLRLCQELWYFRIRVELGVPSLQQVVVGQARPLQFALKQEIVENNLLLDTTNALFGVVQNPNFSSVMARLRTISDAFAANWTEHKCTRFWFRYHGLMLEAETWDRIDGKNYRYLLNRHWLINL